MLAAFLLSLTLGVAPADMIKGEVMITEGRTGEMSLISDEPRSATVVCEEDGVVFTLMRSTFRKVIMGNQAIAGIIRKVAGERRAENYAIEYSESMAKGMK
jgi:hypothetical protein